MKSVEINDLKKYAMDLEFTMEESEYITLKGEFDVLLKQVEMLDNIKDILKYEPMDFPFPLNNSYLREDKACMSLEAEEAFRNSKDVKDGCVKTPKVVA